MNRGKSAHEIQLDHFEKLLQKANITARAPIDRWTSASIWASRSVKMEKLNPTDEFRAMVTLGLANADPEIPTVEPTKWEPHPLRRQKSSPSPQPPPASSKIESEKDVTDWVYSKEPKKHPLWIDGVREQIKAAYFAETGGKHNINVVIEKLRQRLPKIPRKEFDLALFSFQVEGGKFGMVNMENSARITPEMKKGEYNFKGRNMHFVRIAS